MFITSKIYEIHEDLLKYDRGIVTIQNTISTMLKILIPVKRPRVPPERKNRVCAEPVSCWSTILIRHKPKSLLSQQHMLLSIPKVFLQAVEFSDFMINEKRN